MLKLDYWKKEKKRTPYEELVENPYENRSNEKSNHSY